MPPSARAIAVALALAAAPAGAVLVGLDEAQRQAAIAHGRSSYERLRAAGRPIDDIDAEYVRDLGPDVGRAILFTEFATLARETRRYLAIGQPLGPEGVQRALQPVRGRLAFFVVIVGPHRDYLRHHTARLRQGEAAHAPESWDVFKSIQEGPERWVASADYSFAARDVDPTRPVTLALADQAGHEIRFEFDLARLR